MTALRKTVATGAGHSQDTVCTPAYQGEVSKEAVDWLQARADRDVRFDPNEWEVIEGYDDAKKPELA